MKSSFAVEKLILDDKAIRKSLIARLERQSMPPKVILEELRVHNGNAIADVVTVHSTAHCYEIKGETDSIHRILKQGRYYDLVFKRVTLVTTDRHIEIALRLAPPYWGIMRARECNGEVRISYFRPASPSPAFDKRLALLTLWKSELVEVANFSELEKVERLSRAQLSTLLASVLTDEVISKSIGDKLTSRGG